MVVISSLLSLSLKWHFIQKLVHKSWGYKVQDLRIHCCHPADNPSSNSDSQNHFKTRTKMISTPGKYALTKIIWVQSACWCLQQRSDRALSMLRPRYEEVLCQSFWWRNETDKFRITDSTLYLMPLSLDLDPSSKTNHRSWHCHVRTPFCEPLTCSLTRFVQRQVISWFPRTQTPTYSRSIFHHLIWSKSGLDTKTPRLSK